MTADQTYPADVVALAITKGADVLALALSLGLREQTRGVELLASAVDHLADSMSPLADLDGIASAITQHTQAADDAAEGLEDRLADLTEAVGQSTWRGRRYLARLARLREAARLEHEATVTRASAALDEAEAVEAQRHTWTGGGFCLRHGDFCALPSTPPSPTRPQGGPDEIA
jgi:hypothetical protein